MPKSLKIAKKNHFIKTHTVTDTNTCHLILIHNIYNNTDGYKRKFLPIPILVSIDDWRLMMLYIQLTADQYTKKPHVSISIENNIWISSTKTFLLQSQQLCYSKKLFSIQTGG